MSDRKFFTLDDVSIRLSNIKSYGISGSTEIAALDKKIWELENSGLVLPELDSIYMPDDPLASLPRMLVGASAHKIKSTLRKTGKGAKEILKVSYIGYLRSRREELAKQQDPRYLFITTFQGDNHKFYGLESRLELFRDNLKEALEGKEIREDIIA